MVLVYGGSVTALTAVLVHSLIPEFELPDTFPPELVALDPYRLITLGVATLVLLPVVLIVRYPFLTLGSKRLTTAVDRPSMNGHWKQRRQARYWDTSVVLALFFLDVAVLALLGGWLPEDAYLVELALVGLLYEAVCALFKGCTVGKWRHRVRVVGLDDNPVPRRRALGRATVLYAPLLSFGLLQLEAVPAPNDAVLWACEPPRVSSPYSWGWSCGYLCRRRDGEAGSGFGGVGGGGFGAGPLVWGGFGCGGSGSATSPVTRCHPAPNMRSVSILQVTWAE